MKYKNGSNLLPKELLDAVQQYVQGEYIYIPIRDKRENVKPTEYELELTNRDEHIYEKALEGVSNKVLSQLYHLSESSIRRIILKQRKRYEDMTGRISKIMECWAVEEDEFTQIYDTAWQIGNKYIIKIYEDVALLERNIKINTILDVMSIPVGKLLYTKDNVSFAKDEQFFYVLSEKLSGKNITDLKGNLDMAFEMGKIIGDLHLAFKECEKQDEFWTGSLLADMTGWIEEAFRNSDWQLISEDRFTATLSHLVSLYDKLPIQLIHRDVHFGNFLFHEGKFSGYIDFDLSQRNIRIFDLCYFMAGRLSEEEKLNMTETEWLSMLRDVFDGYRERITLTEEEKQAVPYVMQAIELLFAAWFLGEQDTKCAEDAIRIYDFVERNIDKILSLIK